MKNPYFKKHVRLRDRIKYATIRRDHGNYTLWIQRILMRIAKYYEPLRTEWCWAGLVMWSIGYNDIRAIISEDYDDCGVGIWTRECLEHPGTPTYCGRCGNVAEAKR